MKRMYLFFLMAVLLFASGCASDDHIISGEDSKQTQPYIADTSSDSAAESTVTENSTTSSQINETTAGISPTPDEGSDTKAKETTGTVSQEPAKRTDISKPGEQTGNTGTSNIPPAPTEPLRSEPPTLPATSKPEDPEPTPPTESTIPPVDMEAEYARIIREATQYAESYAAKGFTFVWDDSLEFGWETGYMGTPRVKYEGVDGVIEMLKYHIDKIVKVATDPGNGLSGYSANYKVVQVTVDGDIAFVVLYG